ncbi:ankyrin repeat domain-containing protein 50-like [Haliotis asinina]|uniref:ankyrin repeat domain-containing protein 50-like n=1 Tax=Haliotis asinina TaxID=109174 RepID=UPI00353210DC
METHDNRQLHKACRKGDLGRVKHILFQGSVDVNSRGEKHRKTPLMVAAQEGHVKLVHFFVRKGADVSLVDENGDNVLHMACRGGLMAIVKYIVKHTTVDINSKGMRGSTPLLQTVYCGYMDVFIFLVSKEANVSHVDDDGENILHLACRGGHEYMVRYVLEECSVDINSRGNNGETSLMKAASEGHIHVFRCLMSFGANRHLVDTDGDNILHHASIAGHGNMVVFIVTREMVDINSRGKYERTPLMRAAYYGHREICDLLVRFGGRMDLVDDKGHNILHLSALSGQVEMMKYILSLNTTDIDSRTQTGATPLMKAAYVGHKNVFEFLVSNGANVSHVDDRGDNILHHASFGGHTDMVQYILSQNLVNINSREKYGATPLMKAALMGHINVFEYLVRMKANVSQVDGNGENILHYASLRDDTKMVQYILSREMVNINSRGKHRRTALMKAAYYGKGKVVDLLVREGGLTNIVDVWGNNILHLATLGGHLEIVGYILSQNLVDINDRNKDGDTAAILANRAGRPDMYNLFDSHV